MPNTWRASQIVKAVRKGESYFFLYSKGVSWKRERHIESEKLIFIIGRKTWVKWFLYDKKRNDIFNNWIGLWSKLTFIRGPCTISQIKMIITYNICTAKYVLLEYKIVSLKQKWRVFNKRYTCYIDSI